MEQRSTRPNVGFVFGGGGGYGFGFNYGVADGLRDAGVDLFSAPVMGTSAGAITAASLVGEISFEQVAQHWESVLAAQDSPWRSDPYQLIEPLFGRLDPAEFATELRTVAVRLPRWQRLVMTTDHFRVADMVAASCAVPPVVRTVVIDGIRYGDGGLVSGGSADLATDADVLVLITPMSRQIKGVIGAFNSWQARRELAKWQRRTGGDVLHVGPTEGIAAKFSARLSDVASIAIGRSVYDQSREYGREVAARLESLIAQPAAD